MQLGDLHVHSDAITWLVITIENEADFSGLATIDGGPDLHPFRVNVFDGDADVQPDRFELLLFAPGADPYDDPTLHQVRGNRGPAASPLPRRAGACRPPLLRRPTPRAPAAPSPAP